MNSNSAWTCLNNQETARKCCWLLVFNIECRGGVTLVFWKNFCPGLRIPKEPESDKCWQPLPSSFGVCIVTTLRLSSASLLEVTSPYPCKDLNFSQTCSFFLKTRQPQPVRWVCLGELMGRSKLPQIRKITFSFSKQQHTSVQKKEGKKTLLNVLFHNTTDLNCSWPYLLLRSPWISVWQRFWQELAACSKTFRNLQGLLIITLVQGRFYLFFIHYK